MPQVVSFSFFRFGSVRARLWAFVMMGLARPAMARLEGIGFWKLCGSGTGEGFTPRPNLSIYAILATWPDELTAHNAIERSSIFARYRHMASEDWTVFMSTDCARGEWSGKTPFQPSNTSHTGPLAALTRATIKPSNIARFWRRVPDISIVIGQDPNVMFKVGLGELPLLNQVTFSIWPDTECMAGFARTGPHAEAIHAVREEGWFNEELYARFTLLSDLGTWGGTSPLNAKDNT